ncbi:hypothetical protein [Halobellus ordinarius]|uniref:hypothetical protein n=1 Tax=Halobellus ordinarius TaxID=3075120 RepID=UPI002880110A|nr:hypothetical protein [Halobellus sp. ZY16]
MTTTLRDFDGGLDSAEWTGLVTEQSRSGYLIDIAAENEVNDAQRLKLLRCPACGASFDRFWRSARNDPLAEHIAAEHDPADFGLSKRGER